MATLLPRGAGLLPALCFLATAGAQAPAEWWAYRELVRPPLPTVVMASWPRQPFDQFVLAALEARGMRPSPEADAHTLLRRLTYDLTGLPPTAAEIEQFVADARPRAYEQVVDRLLASPQYGVRQARHWLDLVRYAETDGYERDHKKPFVWRYRDWVVEASNADMPYGDFLQRQLAGDELPDPGVADLIATGYYRLGIWDDEPTDKEQHRYDDLDGIADTTARAMLGVSMGCARCHDHKKDPLPQRDYHAFLSFFENLQSYDLKARRVPIDGGLLAHEAALAAYGSRRRTLAERLTRLVEARWSELPVVEQAAEEAAAAAAVVAAYSGDMPSATELLDERGGAHGRVEGQVVAIEGRVGAAMRFDGDDHVVLPRLVQDSFTVAFFVRSDQLGQGRRDDPRWFLGTGLVDGEVPGIVKDWGIAWHSDGRITAGSGDPETFLGSEPGHHDGAWHHVAFSRDRDTGRIALYVDCILVAEAVGSTSALDAPPRLVVGRLQPDGRGFRGDLDELQFFSRALTAGEVIGLGLRLPAGINASAVAASGSEATKQAWDAAAAELSALRSPAVETIEVLAVQELGQQVGESHVHVRGNVHQKGERVVPGFPGMLGGEMVAAAPVPTAASSGRRALLARWIASPTNVLTWRVVANRLWQHHFGRGLVRSSNDFGRLGELPTHPELLDWLACEVLERGGSLKAMHRMLVTSSTYRMVSSPDAAAATMDPQNDLFWRFDRRRLGAEEVRDSILAVAGLLNLEMGGPSVFPPMPAEVLSTASRPDEAWGQSPPDQAWRRSLYVHSKRSLPEPLLASFDQADTDASCPVRFSTVQPTQALVLLNGDFAHQQAAAMAQRLRRQAAGLQAQLELGLRLVTQGPARAADLDGLLRLSRDLQRDFAHPDDVVLQRCCLVLLNCNEFLFLD